MTKMRKIATEEAWTIPEVAHALRDVSRGPSQSLDKLLVGGIYDPPADASGYSAMNFLDGLLDIEEKRLPEMEALGVDMHLLSLTAPGVQMFDADTAHALLAELPEIGTLSKRQVAALAGLAPHAFESGQSKGRASIWGGRAAVRTILFMPAMTAVRIDPVIPDRAASCWATVCLDAVFTC